MSGVAPGGPPTLEASLGVLWFGVIQSSASSASPR
jgi:hypothetical protein